MIQDRLSFHWFDPEQSFVSDLEGFKEKAGRATAVALRRLGPFQIPHAFAAGQERSSCPWPSMPAPISWISSTPPLN
ncbi:hypothetical protein MASR2M17_01490 [Aminivibrio sp.]